jgi:hypothetical protein
VARLERGGEGDQEIGKLVLEGRDPLVALEHHEGEWDRSAAEHGQQDHEPGRRHDRRHQAEQERAAADQVDELDGAQGQVGSLEHALEGPPLLPM